MKMSDKRMDAQEIGEIFYKIFPRNIEWKIPNFYRNWMKVRNFRSPNFEIMDGTGHFEITDSGVCAIPYICLVEDESTVLEDKSFKIGLKNSSGFQSETYSGIFTKDTLNGRKWGKNITIGEFELLRAHLLPAKNSAVTIHCEFQDHTEETQTSSKRESCEDFGKLSQDFKDLLLTGDSSDVTVKVNDSEFHVHRTILLARSPVFASMFKHDMKENNKGVVEICDCAADAFYDFLLYLYTGKVEEFSREKIFDLYLTADKYDINELKSACVKFMEKDLCIDIFCDVLSLALRHEELALLDTVSKFFEKNLKKIIVTAQWQTFLKENPIAANELHIKAINNILPD